MRFSDLTMHSDDTIEVHNENDEPKAINNTHLSNAVAIMATTGMEPEEVAIRQKIQNYANMVEFAPPEPADTIPGLISFSFPRSSSSSELQGAEKVEIKILASFGFVRSLLAKIVVLQVVSKDDEDAESQYYVAAQVKP